MHMHYLVPTGIICFSRLVRLHHRAGRLCMGKHAVYDDTK